MVHIPENLYPLLPFNSRMTPLAFHHTICIYVRGTVTLVCNGVSEGINQLEDSDDLVNCALLQDRKQALEAWKKQSHLLSYIDNGYSHLVKAVRTNNEDLGQGLSLMC